MESSDAAVVKRVLGGEVEAFGILVERYFDHYVRFAVHLVGNREDAESTAAYFREHVQTGAGSFVIVARAFDDIAGAMLAKFLSELVAMRTAPPGALPRIAKRPS